MNLGNPDILLILINIRNILINCRVSNSSSLSNSISWYYFSRGVKTVFTSNNVILSMSIHLDRNECLSLRAKIVLLVLSVDFPENSL